VLEASRDRSGVCGPGDLRRLRCGPIATSTVDNTSTNETLVFGPPDLLAKNPGQTGK
jgi:hypothetical protein